MLKYGLINELGGGKDIGFARVEFDEQGIVSGWLSLPCSGSKDVKSWITFPVNTQVAVLMHSDGEQGEIIGSTWSEVDGPPGFANDHTRGIEFPDGASVYYDWEKKKLFVLSTKVEINGGANGGLVNIDNLISNINARETRINAIVVALQALAAASTALGAIPLLGTVFGPMILTALAPVSVPLTPTLKVTMEDTKVTH